MQLFTEALLDTMRLNWENQQAGGGVDYKPVVKIFDPTGAATWLLTEYCERDDVFFGLCDLGMGSPELGYVSKTELENVRVAFGLTLERDLYFSPNRTLSEYADDARNKGRIDT
jgi:hypothetical protein